jgi:hypothetical protein
MGLGCASRDPSNSFAKEGRHFVCFQKQLKGVICGGQYGCIIAFLKLSADVASLLRTLEIRSCSSVVREDRMLVPACIRD